MNFRNVVMLGMLSTVFAAGAFAADQADVEVTAAVVANCKIQSTQDINFGQLDPAAATDEKATGSVTFACTKDVDYAVKTSDGKHFDASSGSRRMKGAGNDYLPYALAQDSFTGKGNGFSSPVSVDLEASLLGADYKDLPADNYQDVLVVSLNP